MDEITRAKMEVVIEGVEAVMDLEGEGVANEFLERMLRVLDLAALEPEIRARTGLWQRKPTA
jgi:hypothetical protein